MIKSLRIKNLATIEDLEFELREGFSILTGETGAGKSIIIDGIRLVLGEKSSVDMIRSGNTELSVEVVFYSKKGDQISQSFDIESEDGILIQRKIYQNGSGKVYMNGVLIPVRKLKEKSEDLADIYGQNDHSFLRNVENQLNYLDHFSETIHLRREISQKAQKLRFLLKEKNDLETRDKERIQRLEFLDYQIKEIKNVELQPGEEERLREKRHILKNYEKISGLINEAINLSYTDEESVLSLLSRLQTIVKDLAAVDPKRFSEMLEYLDQFSIQLQEFSKILMSYIEGQESSPEELEKIEERLSLIEGLKRKYGENINEILIFLENAEKEYNELNQFHIKRKEIHEEIQKIFTEYEHGAAELTESRKRGAAELEKRIVQEIHQLGMKKARFHINMSSHPVSLDHPEKIRNSGLDEVEFLINPNPGDEFKPLRKIASGGELSRIMLALKSAGKESSSLRTMIFDEIDSGIGGKTAEYVAQKLKNLALNQQVICITHLPQIASFAAHHYRIDKYVEKGKTFTRIKKLRYEERVQEIARLLTGSRITESSLQNARELLAHNAAEAGPNSE
ncbi:MAG: DNA repair protein RecN [Candidatus Aminicenantes bacterium]|nr:DNA repair protein RecN [Candidatus Aminicenantes bacterium]